MPPTPRTYLTDLAGVIPQAQVAGIDARLESIEQRTGHQVIAVFLPSLDGEPLEDFTIRCAESWKVGRKGIDDGAIFFAFVRDHRMRLEVGYGLEAKVPDAVASRLLDESVKPEFARGEYAAGVVALAAGLESVFRGEPPPKSAHRGSSRMPPITSFVLIVAVLLLRALLGGRRGTRRGGFGGWYGGGYSGGGFSGGGFSSGGGSFGGGGASGSW